MDGYEAVFKCSLSLFFGKVSFRAYHHDDFRSAETAEDFFYASSWNILVFEAVGYEPKCVLCAVHEDEVFDTDRLIECRNCSLERLL